MGPELVSLCTNLSRGLLLIKNKNPGFDFIIIIMINETDLVHQEIN